MKLSKLLTTLAVMMPIALSPIASLSSCNKSMKTEIEVDDQVQSGSNQNFGFDFKFSHLPLTPVHIKIVGDTTKKINLVENIVQLDTWNKTGYVQVQVDNSVNESTEFKFSLQFWFTNLARQDEIIKVDGFKIYYTYTPESKKDIVRVKNTLVQKVNEYEFDYRISFSAMPKQDVYIALYDSTGQLSFDSDIGSNDIILPVIQQDAEYFIDLPVYLTLDKVEDEIVIFQLDLLFVNSFGESQEEMTCDLAASFVTSETNIIPNEFFEYKTIENSSKKILAGVSKNLFHPELRLPVYDTLVIPEGVTDIADSALANPEYFYGIRKIVFPNTLQTIHKNGLAGCINLYEMDLTSYETNVPQWMLKKNNQCFPDEQNMKMPGGFVWLANGFTSGQVYNINTVCLQENLSLSKLWCSYPEDTILPEKALVFNGSVLKTVNIAYIDKLPDYQVIKIPEEVNGEKITELGEDCLRLLGFYCAKNPFSKFDSKEFISRRLFLNKNLTKISSGALMEAHIGGPLIFSCPNLEEIGDDAFNLCSTIYGVEERSRLNDNCHFEPTPIVWDRCNSLKTIGNRAFNQTFLSGTLQFPDNLESVGDDAFNLNDNNTFYPINDWLKLEKIIFNKNLQSIGNYSFFYQRHISTLDFRCYDSMPNWTKDGHVSDSTFAFLGIGVKSTTGTTVLCCKGLGTTWKTILANSKFVGPDANNFGYVEEETY